MNRILILPCPALLLAPLTALHAGVAPKQQPNVVFILAADISEQHALAAEHPDTLAALKDLYEAWSADVDADCRKFGLEPKLPKPAGSRGGNWKP